MYLRKIQRGCEDLNSAKLLGVIKENNDTQETLARAIGLSRTRLSAKIYERNGAVFTLPEIKAIRKRYKLKDDAVNAIFFDEKVS